MKRLLLVVTTLTLLAVSTIASATQAAFTNSRSLNGLQEARIYFDVNVKDDELLLFRLKLLDKTVAQLHKDGLRVDVVVGIRGGASRFVTRGDHYVLEEEIANKKKIQELIKGFAKSGMTVEQCVIAAGILEIETGDFLSEINLVGNGYISMVGYQAQGYSVVPMD